MKAAELRAKAREKLNGKWGLAVATAFVAALLGSSSSGPSFSSNFSFDDKDVEKFFDGQSIDSYFSIESIQDINTSMPWLIPLIAGVITILSIWGLVGFILGGAIKVGEVTFFKNLMTTGEAKFNDIFSRFDVFGKALITKILLAVFLTLWYLLLIVPGIIMTYAYSQAYYILEEHPEMSPIDAIKASRALMKGHKWELFCLQISFIGWAILSAMTLGIGGLFLNPYMLAAEYAFYDNIAHNNKEMPVVEDYGSVVDEPEAIPETVPTEE